MIEEDSKHDFELLDDIMLHIEIPTKIPMLGTHFPPMNKSKWRLVQPTRKSSRINISKKILTKAQELKKINNLEIPRMKGMIMYANPFIVLQYEDLENVAKVVGININDDSDSMHSACSFPRADSLSDKDQHEELAENWIDVIRKSRGKHPQEILSIICSF
jgi:hypothetical protein